jgi:hypothetical protein
MDARRFLSSAEASIFRVGPNASLSADGLVVNGERAELRHVDDFKMFVFQTSSAVCTVLAILFPDAVAVPGKNGEAESSAITAWEHYSFHALRLKSGQGDRLESGRIVLQWCLAAWCVAMSKDDALVRSTTDFLPIPLLLQQGGRALAMSVADREQYDHWHRVGSFAALMAGLDSRDPSPAPIAVIIPWPEALGADLGGPTRAFENACRFTSDIIATQTDAGTECALGVLRHYVRFGDAQRLVDAFDREARPEQSQLAVEVDGVLFRAQRNRLDAQDAGGRRQYCFRLIRRSAAG